MTVLAIVVAGLAVALPIPGARTADAGAGAAGSARTSPGRAPTPPAPQWQATDIEGRTWSSDTLRGRVVLLDFWATWCAPCLEDLPRLKRLHARYGGRGLTIIGVSLDRSSGRDFRSWLQRQGIGWPQVRQHGQYDSPLARTFAVDAIPASYLFDRDGRLRATALRGARLDAGIGALMEAP